MLHICVRHRLEQLIPIKINSPFQDASDDIDMKAFVEAVNTLPFESLLYYFNASSVLPCLVIFYILILLSSGADCGEGISYYYCNKFAQGTAKKVFF